MMSNKFHEDRKKQMRKETGKNNDTLHPVNLACLKAREAAEFLGVSPDLLWMLKDQGLIPYYQVRHGARILYPVDGLEQWLKHNRPHLVGKMGGIHE